MLINRQDLLYAIRSARRAPLLTLIVVVALSVGIGLNAGVFTILNYLFLQSPTKKDVSSFVQAYPRYEGWLTSAGQFSSFTTEDYDAIRTQSLTLSEVAASEPTGAMLDDAHKRSPALLVTCNYFRVYGIERPLMGRFFRADECKPGTTERIVVLSEHVWKNHFAANPQIIGKVIHLNREPFIVVGIASDNSANFISGGLWVPYTLQPVFDHGSNLIQNPDTPWLTVVGRLKQGYFRVDAKSELETILHQQDRLYLQRNITTLDRKTSLTLTNGSFIRNPAVQSMVMMLMALIMGPLSLVLMLACTNVTMLFLSRSVVRRGEIAIRLALGGGRARLVRMLVIESFLTAALAGVISVYLAYRVPILIFGVIAPSEAKFAGLIQPNWMVFSFLALLVLIATVVSALAPMRESLKLDLVTALKGRDGAATMRSRTTNAMIIAQLAMSFVLMTAAVLFARLPAMVTGIDPGFETRQTMTVPLDVETPPYTKTSGLAFYRTLESRIFRFLACNRFPMRASSHSVRRRRMRFASPINPRDKADRPPSISFHPISFLHSEFNCFMAAPSCAPILLLPPALRLRLSPKHSQKHSGEIKTLWERPSSRRMIDALS
jgi:predicted permease